MRSFLVLCLGILGIATSFALFDLLLREYGISQILQIRPYAVLIGGVIVALCGAASTWYLGKDIAGWSVNVQALPTSAQARIDVATIVANLSPRFGLSSMPELGVFPGTDINAFIVGRNQKVVTLAVTDGLLEHATPEQAEVVLAYCMAKLTNGYTLTQLLLQGMVAAFTLFPARVFALILGTSLRTADEDTPTDGVEHLVIAGLEFALIPLTALLNRWFSRSAQAQTDRYVASILGRECIASTLSSCTKEHGRQTNREAFMMPHKFGLAKEPYLGWLSYHLTYQARGRRLV